MWFRPVRLESAVGTAWPVTLTCRTRGHRAPARAGQRGAGAVTPGRGGASAAGDHRALLPQRQRTAGCRLRPRVLETECYECISTGPDR